MKFDFFTLIMISAVVDITFGFIFGYYVHIAKSKNIFIKLIILHYLLESISIVFVGLRTRIPDFVSIEISNFIYYLGLYVQFLAIVSFKGKLDKKYAAVLTIATILSLLLFFSFAEFDKQRVIVASATLSFLFLLAAIQLLRVRKPYKMPIFIAIGFLAYSLANIARAFYVSNLPDNYQYIDMYLMDIVCIMTGFFAILTVSIAYILLLKEMDEKLIQKKNKELAELNTTKDKLFSIISHDLRGPVGNIQNFLDMVEMFTEEGDKSKAKQFLHIAKDQSQKSFSLLENLLNWSRSQLHAVKVSPTRFQLGQIFEHTLHILDATVKHKSINICLNLPADSTVYADEEMVKVVVRNLLSNSLKFTDKGGEISIFIKEQDEQVFAQIKDNGVGIEQERLEKLFKFNENKSTSGTSGEKGTGLGLVLSHEFIVQNKGKLWVESQVGKGSSFYFSLPG